ncbi:MAG: DNA-formamidopyrimidine glycosylase family protein [Betaproteobacteria bacterium]
MPEGPTIFLLTQETAHFVGKKIVRAEGKADIDMARLAGKRVLEIRNWGKHFLMQLDGFAVRVHLLLFGSYRINEKRKQKPSLALTFAKGELNFYASSVKIIEGNLDETYDWRGDVMADQWSAAAALKKLRAAPATIACDALLDQDIFAGVGNIIKNETLFRIRVHPQARVGGMPAPKLREMVKQARDYSFEFLEWKRKGVLKKHLLAHQQKTCPRCHIALKTAVLGKTRRRAYYCTRCQVKY